MALDPNTKIVDLPDEELLDVYVLCSKWKAGSLYWQLPGQTMGKAEHDTIQSVLHHAKPEILRRMGASR